MLVAGGVTAPLIENENIVLYDRSWFEPKKEPSLQKERATDKSGGFVSAGLVKKAWEKKEKLRFVSETATGVFKDKAEGKLPEVKDKTAFFQEKADVPVWLTEEKRVVEPVANVPFEAAELAQSQNHLTRKFARFLIFIAFVGIVYSTLPLITAQSIRGVNAVKSFVVSLLPGLKRDAPEGSKSGFRAIIGGKEDPNDFYLKIAKIGLESRVIPNIDAGIEEEYGEALKKGLVHAKGTSLPGKGKMIYIFGHSTNYPWFIKDINALFYKIEALDSNDVVVIKYNGIEYNYRVFDKKVVAAKSSSVVMNEAGNDILVLQTCYPPGTYWKRLLIYCRLMDSKKITQRKTFGDYM